jgi:hypothetical protein
MRHSRWYASMTNPGGWPTRLLVQPFHPARAWVLASSNPSVQIPPELKIKPQLNEPELRRHPEREPSQVSVVINKGIAESSRVSKLSWPNSRNTARSP